MTFETISDIGNVRTENNDSLFAVTKTLSDGKTLGLFVVADGVGEGKFSDEASRIVCDMLSDILNTPHPEGPTMENWQELINESIHRIHQEIIQVGIEHPDKENMASTATVLLISDDQALSAQIGDSRLYSWYNNELRQISSDQTQTQILVDMGRISEEKAKDHPLRHVLSQALGVFDIADHDLNVEMESFPVRNQEMFLLCSDGLYDMVDSEAMSTILGKDNNISEKLQELKQAALDNGGKDNISIILVHCTM